MTETVTPAPVAALIADVVAANRTRIARRITAEDGAYLADLIAANPDAKRVRVYAGGFVPNSYRYACPMQHLEAVRDENGWKVTIGTGDAKRSGGRGPIATVDGRSRLACRG